MKDVYTVTNMTVSSLLGRIELGEIAIPEIQRPFVWKPKDVRDLVDSLYRGFPTGYLITWNSPDVKIKGGGISQGKMTLIDGQQRVTAMMTALAGKEILDKNYNQKCIKIAFNPMHGADEPSFEVLTSAISKSSKWIADISEVFKPGFAPFLFLQSYFEENPGCDQLLVSQRLDALKAIDARSLGVIEISSACSIEEVDDIFIRINSRGVKLSQADFAMSKIASDELHGGPLLRKAVDFFCHTAAKPEFWPKVNSQDPDYASSDYAAKTEWLKTGCDEIYVPDYNDVLRVAFMHQFGRGKLSDLVALLSGRDFKAKDYKEEIVDDSYRRLGSGVLRFMDRNNFNDFVLALRSAGFISSSMINSMGAVDFAYNLYLTLRQDPSVPSTDVKRYVQRWYVMSILTGRYAGSSESVMDRDIRSISERGFLDVYADVVSADLSDTFWNVGLVQNLETANTNSPGWIVFKAAQVREADNTLFSSSVKVSDVVSLIGDVHHLFPKAYLMKEVGATQKQCNQIANYALVERRINIAIGDRSPDDYFCQALRASEDGSSYFGNVYGRQNLLDNLSANCIPVDIFSMRAADYGEFLRERRKLMAAKIKDYFQSL